MHDDLIDSRACVDWAVTQVPVFQEKLAAWNAKRPYEIKTEIDPETGEKMLVAILMRPLDPAINVEVGVIINSIRTSLDLLGATLCRRNGHKPNRDAHFPIFCSEQAMIDPLTGIEGKKWLSKGEKATIKSLKPYQGGDHTLWPLHQLDILRKHERLVSARPDVSGFLFQSSHIPGTAGRGAYLYIGGLRGIERLENKTILTKVVGDVADALDMAKGHANVAAHITLNETQLGIADEEVATMLLRFAGRVSEIIGLFSSP